MTEEKKAVSGLLFSPGAPELVAMKRRAHNINVEYNATFEDETEKRKNLLAKLLGGMARTAAYRALSTSITGSIQQ